MMPGAIMKTALEYLKQSLSILREIGDRAGLCCATLFNIGHIHMANGEFPEAISAWTEVYKIAIQINEAQALAALESMAKQLGGNGLAFWEQFTS